MDSINEDRQFPEILPDKKMLLSRLAKLRQEGFFIADLHVHSAQSDGIHSLQKMAARCIELGVSAAVTDHNRIPDITALSSRELACLIPAIEVTSKESVDILCYFDNFNSLENFYNEVVVPYKIRPYMISLSCEQILIDLKNRNCVVTIPHPDYPMDSLRTNFMHLIDQDQLSLQAVSSIHCIEVFNASRDTQISPKKKQLVERLNKYCVAGSDAHTRSALGNTLTFCKAHSHTDFLNKIATGQAEGIAISTSVVDKSLPKLKMAWLHIKGLLSSG